ncbi:MAG: hypothetical protein JO322_04610 [Candidatus Eremiobacteraeota bacterium]|nr:hypothetical protein [Candidatus Eremiobacteraeota bacterium]
MKAYLAAAACAVVLSACGGGAPGSSGSSLSPVAPAQPDDAVSPATMHASTLKPVPQNAKSVVITEYSNPKYHARGGVTLTKDGSVWWDATSPDGTSSYIVRMQSSVDSATLIRVRNDGYPVYPRGIMTATPNGRAWDDVALQGPSGPGGQPYADDVFMYAAPGMTQASPANGIDTRDAGTAGIANLATDTRGNVWFVAPASIFAPGAEFGSISQDGSAQQRYFPPAAYQLTAITPGPDGTMWIAGAFPAESFARFSSNGTLIGTYSLPSQVRWVNNAVLGPDRAVWFVDNADSLVGRVSDKGSTTLYPTLTPQASPSFITAGGDGALWFTEYNANRVGRITTGGQMTEYALPAAFEGPYQIAGPSTAGCGATQLWIGEQNSGKIAQLVLKT